MTDLTEQYEDSLIIGVALDSLISGYQQKLAKAADPDATLYVRWRAALVRAGRLRSENLSRQDEISAALARQEADRALDDRDD